jgi:hypothetical protein
MCSCIAAFAQSSRRKNGTEHRLSMRNYLIMLEEARNWG